MKRACSLQRNAAAAPKSAGSPTKPTGTAPVRLTFCTLGPAATIVVSCMIGRTADIAHRLGSTEAMTSLMFCAPTSAASIDRWIARSQIPVRFDGARTSGAVAAGADGLVVVNRGLSAGDRVITKGQFALSPGATIAERPQGKRDRADKGRPKP